MPSDRDQLAAIRADRDVIERAARALRAYAIRDSYSGSGQPARAFSLALLLNELGRQVRDVDDELRAVVVQAAGCCWTRPPGGNGSAPAPAQDGPDGGGADLVSEAGEFGTAASSV